MKSYNKNTEIAVDACRGNSFYWKYAIHVITHNLALASIE
jgi:hypothetical protein